MRRLITIVLVLGLVAGALAAPASAKKKKKKAKPVDTVLYLHGNYAAGDMTEFIGSIAESTKMTMDGTEPTDPTPKSMSYSLPIGNDECTGNPLFPSWEAQLSGTIKGDVKLIANFVAAPSKAIARMWIDVPFSSCTSSASGSDAFVEPLAMVEVDVPAGKNEVEIVFEDINVPATANMIVQLHQNTPTNQGRVLYDSPSALSRVEFQCIPSSGNSCI